MLKRYALFVVHSRWKGLFVAFAAGALMALGFAPMHAWPVIFFSLPIFYKLLQTAVSRAQALWRAFAFGYGHAMAGTWWIANALLVDADKFAWMMPFSILGLSAAMAMWFVFFGFLFYVCRARMTPLLFAALWLVVEYARSWGMFGFPWNLAGYISLAWLPVAQMASIVGVYGLSFLVVLAGLLPIILLRQRDRPAQYTVAVIACVLAIAIVFIGVERLHDPIKKTPITLRLVQPNIPQKVKGLREGQRLAIELLGRLSMPPLGVGSPDVTLWPETAYPFNLRAGEVMPRPKTGLIITGAVRVEGYASDAKIWNNLAALASDGTVLASYDKHQLVPFGEFVPLRHLLPLAKITPGDTDFSRGDGPRTLAVGNLPPFSPLICYEVIFPWMAVAAGDKDRPKWLLNVTNDGWYGDSPGPYQHLDAARMRAIEQGLPLVRVANSGVSEVMDGRGLVVASLPLNQRGGLDVQLPEALPMTLYARFGERYLIFMIIILTFFLCGYRNGSENKDFVN